MALKLSKWIPETLTKRPAWMFGVLKAAWPLGESIARVLDRPLVRKILGPVAIPLFSGKNFNITYIPVDVTVDQAGTSTVLPRMILEDLVRRSAHRVSINRCHCRDSKQCKNYPIEDSCLLLGEDTSGIDPRISKHLSVEEALDHVRKKIALGLIPMTGRVRMDDLFYGVPNRGKMQTVCFCCPCCCFILSTARHLPREIRQSLVKLRGLTISINDESCQRCGACVDACFMNAISIEGGRVRRDHEACIGCGRCVTVCPYDAAVTVVVDPDGAVEELTGRIGERVTVE